MRSHAIILRGTSLKERIELKEFLKSKDEPVYELSSAFSRQEFVSTAVYFHYKNYDKEWAIGSRSFNAITIKDFIKKFSTPSQKRNLAFYKESGEPWTPEELQNINKYCGDSHTTVSRPNYCDSRSKWVYDDGSNAAFMWMWLKQDFPSNYTRLSYESVFNKQPDIYVGDKYINSVGKLCVIEELKSDNKVRFLHENGDYYNTSSLTIIQHWTKIKSTPEKEPTMKHICEVLESKVSLQAAINFAQYIIIKNIASHISTNVEQRVVNSISWKKKKHHKEMTTGERFMISYLQQITSLQTKKHSKNTQL